MGTLLTGSDQKGNKEQELISITASGRLAFSISGKPSHPYSDTLQAEAMTPVRAYFTNGLYEVSIFNGSESIKCGSYGRGALPQFYESNIPLFYEQRSYLFTLVYQKENPDDKVELWHESKLIRDAIKDLEKLNKNERCTLVGNINFGNEIGYSEFEIRINGKTEIFLTIEVLPSKMDYQRDYTMMLHDITNEVYNLAFDFLKKTWESADLNGDWGNTDTEFFSIIRRLYDEIISSVNIIVQKGHYELKKYREMQPAYKVKKPDSATLQWMNHHAGQGKRMPDGKVRFDKIESTQKQMTFDTLENQFVKYILTSTVEHLEGLKEKYRRPFQETRYGKKEEDPEIVQNIDQMTGLLRRKISNSFLNEVGKWKASSSLSLVFAMAPGYRELYRNYMKLNMGLRISGDLFRVPMKDTALLYEYWCYIKLNRLIYDKRRADGSRKYPVKEGNLFKVSDGGITVDLQKGKSDSQIRYRDLVNGEEVVLAYNPSYHQGTAISQKPDNVVSITKNGQDDRFSYVFDAKYRINGTEPDSAYVKMYGGPGPVEDTINTMHRYRDAIMARENKFDPDSGFVREMFGAYVLFPYGDEKREYKNHPFYRSIETVNIGGLPFLPGNTGMVEKLLDDLIRESAESSFERASLPVGVAERLQKTDISRRNVLVGFCSSKEQYDFCLQHKVYYWPEKDIDENRFPIEYIALHQTRKLFGSDEAGIKMYGRIKRYATLTGQQIIDRYNDASDILSDRRESSFYVFDIGTEWQKLDHKIEIDNIGHHYYTNIDLLKCSRTRMELSMTSLEQLRLYTELQRLTGSVDIDETEAGQSICGFEYNGKSISKFGDYVYVYKPEKVNKSYLLSYATKCRRKFFEDVMKDVADDTK